MNMFSIRKLSANYLVFAYEYSREYFEIGYSHVRITGLLRAVTLSSYNDLWLCSAENDCVRIKFNDCVRNPKMIVLWCKWLCCVQNPVYFGLEHNHLHLNTIIFGLRTQSLNFAWTQSFSGEHNHRSLYELMVTALTSPAALCFCTCLSHCTLLAHFFPHSRTSPEVDFFDCLVQRFFLSFWFRGGVQEIPSLIAERWNFLQRALIAYMCFWSPLCCLPQKTA